MDEQDVARLLRQVVVTSTHVDYLKDGRAAASLQFNGEPAVVRELLDLVAELSEEGRLRRGDAVRGSDGLVDVRTLGR